MKTLYTLCTTADDTVPDRQLVAHSHHLSSWFAWGNALVICFKYTKKGGGEWKISYGSIRSYLSRAFILPERSVELPAITFVNLSTQTINDKLK